MMNDSDRKNAPARSWAEAKMRAEQKAFELYGHMTDDELMASIKKLLQKMRRAKATK
jgi:hypothetical protein